ncbi:MAG: VOC family protein [Chloroflexi bacterium]|nr:VOC family protein [Chloroflexota bacterium]
MLTGFDHFIIFVNDLDAAMQTFRRLGFDARAGGEHPAFGSHNALIALADGAYIELVAFKNPALAETTFWRAGVDKLRVGAGFGGYVLGSDNLANDVAQIRARGISATDPNPGSRARPDGQRVEWRTSLLNDSPVGALPFLIEDITPRELRIEKPREDFGARARAKEIVSIVKNLAATREQFRALFDVESKHVQNQDADVEGYRFETHWGSIVVAHPTRGGNTMTEQLNARGEGLFALTLGVESWGWERQQIKARGIKIENEANGFLIAPEEACGARIRIVQK